ncbi:hypothetical protein K488DRAFT_72163 [Vararia minispora EC-137]|uniref:Uncharacterized protein n=1 Tax=Vararia minispora EC-137 TaxID=1314806 RepID=A0ACB8QF67_9AGAM|nr:hypothetical protein K488DRAFT_72163 [Vararia minispora EC-137]
MTSLSLSAYIVLHHMAKAHAARVIKLRWKGEVQRDVPPCFVHNAQDNDSSAKGAGGPICRLPPEIILFIFSIIAEDYPPSLDYDSTIQRLGWITVTHVCNAWRRISIGTAKLWARGLGRLPRALSDFRERAGDAIPVDLTASVKDGQSNEGGVWFSDGEIPLSRIRSIEVNMADTMDSSLTRMLAGGETSALESLVINLNSPGYWILKEYEGPEPLYAPQLRTASLKKNFVPLRAASLTVLSLELKLLGTAAAPFLSVLFTTISYSPSLQALKICHLYAEPEDFEGVTACQQPLHHLESIVLEAFYPLAYSRFLDKLSFPASTMISIASLASPRPPTSILSSVARAIWRDVPPNGLEVGLAKAFLNLAFFSFATDHDAHPDPSLFPSSAKPRAEIRHVRYSLSTELRRVASEVDLSTIVALSIRSAGEDNLARSVEWADVFAVLPGVRTLHLDMAGKLDASIFTVPETRAGELPSLFLPHLERL